MTTHKEALTLALEALKQMKAQANFDCWNLNICDEAIATAEEALAQQCVCGEPNSAGTHRTDGPCLAPQPEQEPVAWMIWTHGPVLVFMKKDEADMEFDRLNQAYPEPTRMLVPLYTTPPQRKPLTTEQKNRMANNQAVNGWLVSSTLRAAYKLGIDDTEAAHGIKGGA